MDQISTSSRANATQVGGSHYQDAVGRCPECGADIQHWDLFALMPYLIGQVCKYVMRFRDKNGLEDLKKARHFLDKLIEVYYPTRINLEPPVDYQPVSILDDLVAIEAAKARADAFASQKTDSDVPPGWVLEEVTGRPGIWHYRRLSSGLWSVEFSDRAAALTALKKTP